VDRPNNRSLGSSPENRATVNPSSPAVQVRRGGIAILIRLNAYVCPGEQCRW
jgi:hypothetical protein